MAFMPQVPSVRRCARRHIDAFFHFVQLLLIVPLAIIDLRWSTTATMHRDQQRSTTGRLVAEGLDEEGHCFIAHYDLARFDFLGPLALELRLAGLPKQSLCDLGVGFAEWLFGEGLIGYCPAIV